MKKRGRKRRSSVSSSSVENKEQFSEDWCFICKDGGLLLVCDFKDCLKAYHPECVEKDSSFLETGERWTCSCHSCFLCRKSPKFYCYCCPNSVCKRCISVAEFVHVRRKNGFCNNCLKLALLIEENVDIDSDGGKIDFEDRDTYEFLFKGYWDIIKEAERLTLEDLHSADILLKKGESFKSESDSEGEELDEQLISNFDDMDDVMEDGTLSFMEYKGKQHATGKMLNSKVKSKKMEFIGWGSRPLIDFLGTIGKDPSKPFTQYEVHDIIMEYIRQYKLNDPERKKKIIFDTRLRTVFGKKSTNRNKIYDLLEPHFAANQEESEGDELGYNSEEEEGTQKTCKRQKRMSSDRALEKEKVSEAPRSCFASVTTANIKLVYLKRSLVEDFSRTPETFEERVKGSFVRIKTDPNDYLQRNSHQLVQVIGVKNTLETSDTCKDIILQVSNIHKDVHIWMLSDDDFSEFITDNGSNYKAAGAILEEQHPKMFWTPCAAHCVNLMLQEIGEKIPKIASVLVDARKLVVYIYNHGRVLFMMRKLTSGRELHRSCVTRFATSFYTLRSIHENRHHLQVLFVSEAWAKSAFAKKQEGKRMARIVSRNDFWDNVELACQILAPLVDVVRLVDTEIKPCMGYVYDAMVKAKDQIQKNLGNGPNTRLFTRVWEIVSRRWAGQFGHPLHAAGYYLNPSIYYKQDSSVIECNTDIKMGLYSAIDRLVPDPELNDNVLNQLIQYRENVGMFGTASAIRQRDRISAREWWMLYGIGAPDLQKFVLKVLGLTCSASPCERNWITFDNEECDDLHQRVKDGLLKRPTIWEFEQKAKILHEDITYHWIERELVLLQNLIDRANEKGWRRELCEYLEKQQLLQSPSERLRLMQDVPKVTADEIELEATTLDLPKDENFRGDDSPRSILAKAAHTVEDLTGKGTPSDPKVGRLNPSGSPGIGDAVTLNASPGIAISNSAEEEVGTAEAVKGTAEKDAKAISEEAQWHFDVAVPQNQRKQSDTFVSEHKSDALIVEEQAQTSDACTTKENKEISDVIVSTKQQSNLTAPAEDQHQLNSINVSEEQHLPMEVEEQGINEKLSLNSTNGDQKKVEKGNVSAVEVIELDDEEDEDQGPGDAPGILGLEDPESESWHYVDPFGDVQGPFSMMLLKKWSESNYFQSDFRVWKTGQSQESAILLIDVLSQIFSKNSNNCE